MSIDGGKQIWDDMWEKQGEINENNFFACVVDTVLENLDIPIRDAKILEAGAGTGTSSFQLAKRGAKVTVVDYSQPAIDMMKRMFERNKIDAEYLCNDIRNMAIDDNTYDIVFNSGVLEHFDYSEQVKIIKEMGRITKPGGKIIVLVPNAKCLLYRVWKWILETSNAWSYGEEIPVSTLEKQFNESGINIEKEYSVGFENSVEQFASFREFSIAAQYIKSFYDSIPQSERKLFEGYLLCSVGKK